MAHGGWRSLAHRRYDRFSLREVLGLPEAMLQVGAVEQQAPAAQAPVPAVQEAAPLAEAAGSGAAARPATLQPLTPANCVGRRVLCPRAMWPSRPCRLHGGAGWEAIVRKARSQGSATEVYVDFLPERAGKPADRPMWLQLDGLLPLR